MAMWISGELKLGQKQIEGFFARCAQQIQGSFPRCAQDDGGILRELREGGLGWQGGVRTALAFALCVLMVDQPLMAAGNQDKRGPTAQGAKEPKGENRVEHALNRLTFGPRPGDVAAVEKMGLTEWFEQQLNPEKIDDSALDARLQSQFPAMFLSQQELVERYPSQQVIRQLSLREDRGDGMGAAGSRSCISSSSRFRTIRPSGQFTRTRLRSIRSSRRRRRRRTRRRQRMRTAPARGLRWTLPHRAAGR
jgi:hypothetical protein